MKVFTILLLIITTTLFSQNESNKFYLVESFDTNIVNKSDKQLLDSCLTRYHKSNADTTKISLLAFIAENIENQDVWPKYNKLVFEFSSKKLENINQKNNDEKLFYLDYKNRSLINYGYLYLMKGNVDKALEYYKKSKEILEITNDKLGLAAYYNSTGYIHINQGSIKKGLDLLLKSLKIREKLNDLDAIATSLTNIGYVYKSQNEQTKALEYFEKSLTIRKLLNDKSGEAMCLGHLGALYDAKNEKDKAYDYYYKALKISEQTSNKYSTAYHLHNIGTILAEKEDYENAKNYHERSLTIRRKISDIGGIASSLCKLGNINFKQGNINKAIVYAKESMSLANELNYPKEIAEAANLMQKIYRKQNKWKQAFKMYELENIMKDSLNNKETQKATITQQMQYNYEKEKMADSLEFATQQAIKDLAIKESKAKIEVQKAESKILYGGILLLILIVAAALWIIRGKKRDNEIISSQKKLVEEKNKEIVDSIRYAKRIQKAILPPDKTVKKHLKNSFILYKPKDIVAGDFYWMECLPNPASSSGQAPSEGGANRTTDSSPSGELEENIILFAVADCTGHGVPGAMVSVICNNALNRSVRERRLIEPGLILDKSREIVIQEFEKSDEEVSDGMDIALCSLSVNSNQSAVLQYAGAHNPLWIISPSLTLPEGKGISFSPFGGDKRGGLHEIKANKQPIGKTDNPQPYTTHTIELQKGDTVYIFSDGYADQFGGVKGKKLKSANFKKLLLSIQNETMEKQLQLIDEAFENWKGNTEQIDDVCVIGVKV